MMSCALVLVPNERLIKIDGKVLYCDVLLWYNVVLGIVRD